MSTVLILLEGVIWVILTRLSAAMKEGMTLAFDNGSLEYHGALSCTVSCVIKSD